MSPKGILYHVDYAKELLQIAEGDLASARGLAKLKEGRPENICFLAQQAAEKAMKAVLCHHRKEIIHTHDLEALAMMLPTGLEVPHEQGLGSLTQYALLRRYEEGYEILKDDDFKVVISAVDEIINAYLHSLC